MNSLVETTHTSLMPLGRSGGARLAAGGEYLAFELRAETYGIELQSIQEIRMYQPPTKIANSPPYVKGVLNLRGTITPILDLRMRMGCDDIAYGAFTVIVILNVYGRYMGAVVDSVSDVIRLSDDEIKPAPEMPSQSVKSGHVTGIGTAGDRMLVLLDIASLMTDVRDSYQ